MSRLFMFAVVFFQMGWAGATVQNVAIQCHPEGPVFAGTVEYPATVADWSIKHLPANECDFIAKIPLRIEFNGMTYLNASPSRTYAPSPGSPGSSSCEKRFALRGLEMMTGDYDAINAIGYRVNAHLVVDPKDKQSLNLVQFRNRDEVCFVF